MKDLEYYKKLKYRMAIEFEPDDNVYFARFPELPGCMAHGETPEVAAKNAMTVKDEWLATAIEAGWDVPEPTMPVAISGRITVRTPKSLHQSLVERAQQEGVSLNQLIVAYLAESMGRGSVERSINRTTSELHARIVAFAKNIKHERVQSFAIGDTWPHLKQLKTYSHRSGIIEDLTTSDYLTPSCKPYALTSWSENEDLQRLPDDDINVAK